jgi:RimJ/RimL family protein N-acetyltransferase
VIETQRLILIPASVQSLRAEAARDMDAFARLIGVERPQVWPPDLYDDEAVAFSLQALQGNPKPGPWTTYYFVLRAPRVLVGAGGFVRPPDAKWSVELGYSVLAAHRRKGYASEATAALVARAFAEPKIRAVIAHTYPDLVASIGVLEKCGFRFAGSGAEEGVVCYRRGRR